MKQPGLRFTIANTDWDALRRSAQQEERRRIARELHDTLLQGFTSIALKLDALATSLLQSCSWSRGRPADRAIPNYANAIVTTAEVVESLEKGDATGETP
jgi:signal transduction histidine kinase